MHCAAMGVPLISALAVERCAAEGGKLGLDGAARMRQDGDEKGWNERWAGTP
jgi:hypothetical protein